jgi:hypothetical protein
VAASGDTHGGHAAILIACPSIPTTAEETSLVHAVGEKKQEQRRKNIFIAKKPELHVHGTWYS